MKRNLESLSNQQYDLLIIGGGIYGAMLFWHAARWGISVALVEKDDFGQATSFNSQKIIHGGLRYLQQFDIARMRQSIGERKGLMNLAPYLVNPIPSVMPLYGHGLKGREAMWAGLKAYDLISADRNWNSDKAKRIPSSTIIDVEETLRIIPGLETNGLMGGAKWYDAICMNTERLIIDLIKTAVSLGGEAANYVKASDVLRHQQKVKGVKAIDQLTGESFDVCASKIVWCVGPWTSELYSHLGMKQKEKQTFYASGINVIVKKIFPSSHAVAINSQQEKRLYFVVPWHGKSILGTQYFRYDDSPSSCVIKEQECMEMLEGFNASYAPAKLSLKDISFVHKGILPCSAFREDEGKAIHISKQFEIVNFEKYGFQGMTALIGVKYTTAGCVTLKALNQMFPESLRKSPQKPFLLGCHSSDWSFFKKEALQKKENSLPESTLRNLLGNYGCEYGKVLELMRTKMSGVDASEEEDFCVLKGQALFAVQNEMAFKLSDVILRRTALGTAHCPEEKMIEKVSTYLAHALGWNEVKRLTEIDDLRKKYPCF